MLLREHERKDIRKSADRFLMSKKSVIILSDERVAEALSDSSRVSLLLLLSERQRATIQDLARVVGKHRSTVSRHMSKLLEAGLVERTLRGDTYEYYLTDKGTAIVNEIKSKHLAVLTSKSRSPPGVIALMSLGAGALVSLVPVKIHAITRLILASFVAVLIYFIMTRLWREVRH